MNALVSPLTWILGIVFVLVGIAGFFSGDTLIVFQVDVMHNIVHVLSGVVALFAVSKGRSYARMYLILFGLVYGLVAVLGFMGGSVLGLFMVNTADNYLHAAIAAASLIVGFGSSSR